MIQIKNGKLKLNCWKCHHKNVFNTLIPNPYRCKKCEVLLAVGFEPIKEFKII